MNRRSPFDYDVSVAADKARRQRRRGMSGAFETSTRACERNGCGAPATYRAPASPERLDEYRWFCLDHVREYNRTWNFFENHSEEELEARMRADSVWDRPTWSFGEQPKSPMGHHPHAEGQAWRRFGFDDLHEVLGENATLNPGPAGAETPRAPRRRLPANERRALDILQLPQDSGRDEARRRYRALVKDLHPDMNGGKRDDEARLSRVIWAWEQIKDSRNFRG